MFTVNCGSLFQEKNFRIYLLIDLTNVVLMHQKRSTYGGVKGSVDVATLNDAPFEADFIQLIIFLFFTAS